MIITEQSRHGAKILVLAGRFDYKALEMIQGASDRAKDAGPRKIVLNFKDVSFVDSSGLQLIVRNRRRLTQCDIALDMVSVGGCVRDVFNLVNFSAIVCGNSSEKESVEDDANRLSQSQKVNQG